MSFWRQSVRRSLIMIVQAAGSRVCGILSNVVLARMLTPSAWGSLQAVSTLATSLAQTLKLSVDGGLQVRLSETHPSTRGLEHSDYLGTAVGLLLMLSVLALGIGFGFSDSAAHWFGDASLAKWMGLSGIGAAAQLIAQLGVVLVAFGDFKTYAAIQLFTSIAYVIALALAFAAGSHSLIGALAIYLALQVVTALLTVLFAVRAWRVRGLALRWSRAVRAGGALLRFSLPVHLASAIPAAVWLGVTAELARRWGMASLADLRVITMLNQIVGFIPAAIAQTFVTQFAAARGAEARVPVQDFMRYVRVIISGALVTALPVALIAPLLIPRLFGAAYAHTAPLVNLGLMTATVLTLKQAIMVALLSENRTVFALGDAVVSSLVCALVARWSIPALGVTGFVLAELLAHVTGALTLVLAMALRVRHAGVGRQAGAAAGLLLYVLAAMTAGYFTQNPAAHALLLTAALVVGIAGCACFVFDSHERGAALREVQRLLGAAKPYDG